MVDFGAQSLHLRCGSMTPASRTTQFVTKLNVRLSVGLVANLYPSRTHTYKNSYALLGTPIYSSLSYHLLGRMMDTIIAGSKCRRYNTSLPSFLYALCVFILYTTVKN